MDGQILAILINQHVRRMRGGTQSHLMRGVDGNFYIVKFQNNPQHVRILANDFLGTRIASRVGLPVPAAEIVEVGSWLIDKTPELNVQLAGIKAPCKPGLQYGSRFVIHPMDGQVIDYMPEAMMDSAHLRNIEAFAGALAFDKWTCNADRRQVVYGRRGRERKYTVTMVDQGHCFNGEEWNFPDSPLRGAFGFNQVYASVRSWESFQPWLERIEHFPEHELIALAESIPAEWYDGEHEALDSLVRKLLQRRRDTRRLIEDFRLSSYLPFSNWYVEGKSDSAT